MDLRLAVMQEQASEFRSLLNPYAELGEWIVFAVIIETRRILVGMEPSYVCIEKARLPSKYSGYYQSLPGCRMFVH